MTLDEIERQYSRLVWKIAHRLTHYANLDPNDFWSEGLLAIYLKQGEYRPEIAHHAKWAHMVAQGKIHHMIRSEMEYRSRSIQFSDVDSEKLHIISDSTNVERDALDTVEAGRLWDAVDRLPDREKVIVRRRYINGDMWKVIGRALRVHQNTALLIHRRAIGRLRNSLVSKV